MDEKIEKQRDSNLELFRIITMLLIVAHHYVVNSGLMEVIRGGYNSMVVLQNQSSICFLELGGKQE